MTLPGFTAELGLGVRPAGYVARTRAALSPNTVTPQLPRGSGWLCDFIWDCCYDGNGACCWYWIFNCAPGEIAVANAPLRARP
jgi:hypothetical protein